MYNSALQFACLWHLPNIYSAARRHEESHPPPLSMNDFGMDLNATLAMFNNVSLQPVLQLSNPLV